MLGPVRSLRLRSPARDQGRRVVIGCAIGSSPLGDTARRAGDFEMWRTLKKLEVRDRHKVTVKTTLHRHPAVQPSRVFPL